MMKYKKILITGTAGFIGYHLAKKISHENNIIIGLDNINSYYSESLKIDRLKDSGFSTNQVLKWDTLISSKKYKNYSFIRMNLEEKNKLNKLFKKNKFDLVIHLAAQAGVRYSLENPDAYIQSNIVGFVNILEACKKYSVKKIVYASSSSVYGNNNKIPFSETDNVDHPVSLYAATKKSNELLAHTYSHLYGIKTIGLRFFTVYGPWGRPDMAYYSFSKAIKNKKKIKVFNNGNMERDFTYIDDVVDAIFLLLNNSHSNKKNHSILNIGNNNPEQIMDFINILEKKLDQKAILEFSSMQKGDVYRTYADITEINKIIDFKPLYSLEDGLSNFIRWFKEYEYSK